MKHWNTNEMIRMLKHLIPGVTLRLQDGEAGHWTDEIIIEQAGNDFLTLGAFTLEDSVPEGNTHNVDIDYLYLYDQSGNGLQSKDSVIRKNYYLIKDHLEILGYSVESNTSDHF